MNDDEICPVCGIGRLKPRQDTNYIPYKGRNLAVPIYYSVCDYCGSEIADERQSNMNKEAARKAKEMVNKMNQSQEDKRMHETSDQKTAMYWNEGYEAFLDGAERVHCPYDEGTEAYIDWMAGFDCSEGDSND